MVSSDTPVWFITGVSAGLGFAMSIYILSQGHHVIGTVRSRSRAAESVKEIENKGGKCLELDVTDAEATPRVYSEAIALYGRIDVLVNNAGYSWLGAVEDSSDEEARAQFETNVFGPLRLIRTVLPAMRERKSGTIVNITSIAALDALASAGLYAGSKFALEGISEALAREVSRFNISVLLVEPGAFRTKFLHAAMQSRKESTKEYVEVQEVLKMFESAQGKQRGDPVKASARIFETVTGQGRAGSLKGKVLRLPLGPDCVKRYEQKAKKLMEDLDRARDVASMDTDIIE